MESSTGDHAQQAAYPNIQENRAKGKQRAAQITRQPGAGKRYRNITARTLAYTVRDASPGVFSSISKQMLLAVWCMTDLPRAMRPSHWPSSWDVEWLVKRDT